MYNGCIATRPKIVHSACRYLLGNGNEAEEKSLNVFFLFIYVSFVVEFMQ